MKCNAFFIGAKPIPLGSAESKKKEKILCALCVSAVVINYPNTGIFLPSIEILEKRGSIIALPL
jgi:hypothetical protein